MATDAPSVTFEGYGSSHSEGGPVASKREVIGPSELPDSGPVHGDALTEQSGRKISRPTHSPNDGVEVAELGAPPQAGALQEGVAIDLEASGEGTLVVRHRREYLHVKLDRQLKVVRYRPCADVARL